MRAVITESKKVDGADTPSRTPLVAVVDNDQSIREALEKLLGSLGLRARVFASREDFINSDHLTQSQCLILDVHTPGISGLEHKARLVLLTLTPPRDREH